MNNIEQMLKEMKRSKVYERRDGMKEYAVYKGEEVLIVGTVREIAKALNVKERTVYFWATPSNHKRERQM